MGSLIPTEILSMSDWDRIKGVNESLLPKSIQKDLTDNDRVRGITRRWVPAKTIVQRLEAIRNNPSSWKSTGAGGQDQYAGLPPFLRDIDEIIKLLK